MSTRNETGLVKQIRSAIVEAYPEALVIKIHGSPYMPVGIPDLVVCVQGLFVGIEVKHQKPGESHQHALGRVTEVQHRQLERIRTAGGTAGAATSAQEALAIIEEAVNGHRAGGELVQ